jgi:hypothetical protein
MTTRTVTAVPGQIGDYEPLWTGLVNAASLETILFFQVIEGGRVMSGGEATFVY